MSERLAKIRKEIDVVDDSIAELLCKRAGLAKEVREVKATGKINPYSPTREKEIIDRVLPSCAAAGYSPKGVNQIFLSVLSACRAIVGVFEVCFADNKFSMTHRAMVEQFGPIENYKSTQGLSSALERVVNGVSKFSILPISSSSSGIYSETIEELIKRPIRVFSSISLVDDFSLYGSVTEINQLEVVYGFGATLEKISTWASSFMPNVKLVALSDYSKLDGVCTAIKGGEQSAVLLATGFSEELGLSAVVERIPLDNPDKTRYFVVEHIDDAEVRTSENVTAIVCAIKDMVGALSTILEAFSKRNITLKKIESRAPQNISWECIFYLEAEGASHSDLIKECVKELEGKCTFVKVLGGFGEN